VQWEIVLRANALFGNNGAITPHSKSLSSYPYMTQLPQLGSLDHIPIPLGIPLWVRDLDRTGGTMLAFHNDPGLRDFILATLAELREADKLDKYHYWEDGSGSAVGCTLEAVRLRRGMGDSFDHSSHALYETELGIPRVLAHLEDKIFERLPYEASQRWPERFISVCIPAPT